MDRLLVMGSRVAPSITMGTVSSQRRGIVAGCALASSLAELNAPAQILNPFFGQALAMDQHPAQDPPTTTSSSLAPGTNALRPLRGDATLSPRNHTQLARVLEALHRVAAVAVTGPVKEDGHQIYTIHIELKSSEQSVLRPTSLAPGATGQAQAKHSFREFTNLRRELYFHAHAGHRDDNIKAPCGFCAPVVEFLTHSPSIPRTRNRLFGSTESLRPQLESFLNQLVDLAIKAKSSSPHRCEGQELVPLLVKKFLLGDGGEEDLSDLAPRPIYNASYNVSGWSDF